MFRCFGVFRSVPGCFGVPGFSTCPGVEITQTKTWTFLPLIYVVRRDVKN